MSFIEIVKAGMQGKNFPRFFIFVMWSLFVMYFTMWVVENGNTLTPQMNNVVHFLLGILYGTMIVGGWNFYFGTTQGSGEKDESIKTLANTKTTV